MKKKERKSRLLLWRLLLVLFALNLGSSIHAQDVTVTGKVLDTTGEPMIGVSVVVKSTKAGVITDLDGNFSIKCSKGALLRFTFIGNKVAPITYGFTIGGKWKGFMLDIFFQGMAGHKKLMDFRGNGINAHTSTFKYYNDHWTPENTNASMPGATQYKNNEASSFWVRNASFLRCKNISISYDLPKTFVQRIGIDKARLFLNGTNLFLLQDKVKWMDPEATSISDYPVMRNFSFGLNITI